VKCNAWCIQHRNVGWLFKKLQFSVWRMIAVSADLMLIFHFFGHQSCTNLAEPRAVLHYWIFWPSVNVKFIAVSVLVTSILENYNSWLLSVYHCWLTLRGIANPLHESHSSSPSWTFLSICLYLHILLWERALSPYWAHKFMWTRTPCIHFAH